MNNNTLKIIIGLVIFLLISGGIVFAVVKLSKSKNPTNDLAFFHLEQANFLPNDPIEGVEHNQTT